MMTDKTIVVIVLLLAATLMTLVGQIGISIAQHQAEGFFNQGITSHYIYKLQSSGDSSGSNNNINFQTSDNTGNNAA